MSAITYRSATSIAQAVKADASIGALYAKAYADAAADITQDGANLRDMATAITGAGVKCSKDTASDFIRAHSLTVHGKAWDSALADVLGEGHVLRAHTLIAKARKARRGAYVDAVLASLSDKDGEDLAKALRKAIRELDAAKPEPKAPEAPESPEGPDSEGEGEGPEAPEVSESATPESKAASIIVVADSLRADIEGGARMSKSARVNLMRSLAALADAMKAADAADAAA